MKISPKDLRQTYEQEFYKFRYSSNPREALYFSDYKLKTKSLQSNNSGTLHERPLKEEIPPQGNHSDESEPCKNLHRKGGDDLFACIRIPLIIGAFLGLIPITNLSDSHFHHKRQRFAWLHYRTIISISVTSLILCNTFLISYKFLNILWNEHNSAGNLVLSFSGVWFYSAGTLVYFFFLLRSRSLTHYFRSWLSLSIQLQNTLIPDPHVIRDVCIICFVVMLDSLGENTLYHFHAHAKQFNSTTFDAFKPHSLTFQNLLEDFFQSNQYLSIFFSYSPPVALIFLVSNKLTTYAWNFGDLFLMVSFRLLSSRFSSLNAYLDSSLRPLQDNNPSLSLIAQGQVDWSLIRHNFLRLNELLEEGNALLAPLIWLSYTTDIFFVCRQLYEGLSPGQEELWMISKIYVGWSLLHLIMRTIGVNLLAAKINEEAHRLSNILQHCHPHEYDDNVRRLERFVAGRVIGITGNGCFIITRSFILMVISAIFTLEVVLLQNASLTLS